MKFGCVCCCTRHTFSYFSLCATYMAAAICAILSAFILVGSCALPGKRFRHHPTTCHHRYHNCGLATYSASSGYLRPHKSTPPTTSRKAFAWFHFLNGLVIVGLIITQIFFGLYVLPLGTAPVWYGVFGAYIAGDGGHCSHVRIVETVLCGTKYHRQ